MNTQRVATLHAAVAHIAYGIDVTNKDVFSSPFAYDNYDMWFGEDFDFIIAEMMDSFLREIESDITSVDSSNLSEAHSRQISLQECADRSAKRRAGFDVGTSVNTGLT